MQENIKIFLYVPLREIIIVNTLRFFLFCSSITAIPAFNGFSEVNPEKAIENVLARICKNVMLNVRLLKFLPHHQLSQNRSVSFLFLRRRCNISLVASKIYRVCFSLSCCVKLSPGGTLYMTQVAH